MTQLLLSMIFSIGCSLFIPMPDTTLPNVDNLAKSSKDYSGIDYFHFWIIACAQRDANIESVYLPTDHPEIIRFADAIADRQNSLRLASLLRQNRNLYETELEPTGSPFLYTVTGLLRTGDFDRDFLMFQSLSCLLFVVGVYLLGQTCGLKLLELLALSIALFMFFKPLQIDVLVANTNRCQVFLFGLFAWLIWKNKIASGGIILGLAIAFKPNFLFVFIFAFANLLVRRQWKANFLLSTGALSGGLSAILAGAIYFGSLSSWTLWKDYLQNFIGQTHPIESGNYSIHALLDCSPLLVSSLIVAVGMVTATTRELYVRNCESWNLATIRNSILGVLVILLASPLVWSHYYVLAIPGLIFLWGSNRAVSSRRIGILMATAVVLFVAAGVTSLAPNPTMITIMLQSGVALIFTAMLLVSNEDHQLGNIDR